MGEKKKLHRPTQQINSFLQKANLFQSELINLELKMAGSTDIVIPFALFFSFFYEAFSSNNWF